MRAAYVTQFSEQDPLSGLRVGEMPEPDAPDDWVSVDVRAAALNHHDVWSLRGVALGAEHLPMILGTDAAGVTEDGAEVIVHAVMTEPPDTPGDPAAKSRTLLSEKYPGTLAQRLAVPRLNLVPKPEFLTMEEAACLPTAYLTAYRALFTRGRLQAGQSVLIQGAGGGVASAAISLARAAGATVFATSRSAEKRDTVAAWGAHPLSPSERLPHRTDLVLESVGEATWEHSMRSLAPNGRLVVIGATAGREVVTDLRRIFYHNLSILGSTMGTRVELLALTVFLQEHRIRPVIDSVFPLDETRSACERLLSGDVMGKVVLTV